MNYRIAFFSSPNSHDHVFFISPNGNLFSCGRNLSNQLALSKTFKKDQTVFRMLHAKKVPDFSSFQVKKVALGAEHSIILTQQRKAFSVGLNNQGQLGLGDAINRVNPTLVTQFGKRHVQNVYDGYFHSLFMVDDMIFGCGNNKKGQLGVGDNIAWKLSPVRCKIFVRVIDVSGGTNYTLFLTEKNQVFKAGEVFKDKLCIVPTLIEGFPLDDKIIRMSGGSDHALFLGSKKIYGIGSNESNKMTKELKNEGVKIVTEISCLSSKEVVSLKAGTTHSLLLTKKGVSYVLGDTQNIPNSSSHFDTNGVAKISLNEITHIEIGRRQSYFFKYDINKGLSNKKMLSCGYNKHGVLMNGSAVDKVDSFQVCMNEFLVMKDTIVFSLQGRLTSLYRMKKLVNVTIVISEN